MKRISSVLFRITYKLVGTRNQNRATTKPRTQAGNITPILLLVCCQTTFPCLIEKRHIASKSVRTRRANGRTFFISLKPSTRRKSSLVFSAGIDLMIINKFDQIPKTSLNIVSTDNEVLVPRYSFNSAICMVSSVNFLVV